jgi:DHA2 family multidrug resistance protein
VFYLNVPLGLVAMVLGMLVIPNVREAERRSLDFPGLITLAVFIVSLLIALTQGQRYGWDDVWIQRLLLIAGISFVGFVITELTRKEPLVELRLYKNIGFAVVSFAVLLNALNFWGTNFLQTILLQRLFDYTPAQAGYATLPGALLMSFTTMYAGKLADQIDRRYVILFGLATFGLASWAFSALTLDRSMAWVMWMILGRYLTIGFVYTPMNAASLMTLPPAQMRMGSGLINIMQQGIGGTVGLAIMTTMLQRRTTYHASMLDQHQVASPLPWHDVIAPAWELMRSAGEMGEMIELKASALLYRHLVQQATVAAYADCFMLVAVLCFVAMVPICFIRRYQGG